MVFKNCILALYNWKNIEWRRDRNRYYSREWAILYRPYNNLYDAYYMDHMIIYHTTQFSEISPKRCFMFIGAIGFDAYNFSTITFRSNS